MTTRFAAPLAAIVLVGVTATVFFASRPSSGDAPTKLRWEAAATVAPTAQCPIPPPCTCSPPPPPPPCSWHEPTPPPPPPPCPPAAPHWMAAATTSDAEACPPVLAANLPPMPLSLCAALSRIASKLVILVLVSPNARLDIVQAAWAHGVQNVHYVGQCPECTVRTTAQESWGNLPAKVLEMFHIAVDAFPTAEVFLKLDADAFLHYPNLLLALHAYQSIHGVLPSYMGSLYDFNNIQGFLYTSGGAGYIISRAAASKLEGCDRGSYEDVSVGLCMRAAGVKPFHHPGFIGDDMHFAMKHWLVGSDYHNHVSDPVVPRHFITVHGYKDPLAMLMVAALSRSASADWFWAQQLQNGSVWGVYGPPFLQFAGGPVGGGPPIVQPPVQP